MTTACVLLWPTVMDHRAEDARIARVFRERLLLLMEEAGIDPEKGEHLARRIGASKGTGYNLLTPGKKPSARTLTTIARAFGTTADFLLGLSDEAHPRAVADDAARAAGERLASHGAAEAAEALRQQAATQRRGRRARSA